MLFVSGELSLDDEALLLAEPFVLEPLDTGNVCDTRTHVAVKVSPEPV